MSWQASKMAKSHRVGSPSWKAILYAIAERTHDDGRGCTALYDTIAEESETSKRTVVRAVKAMLEAGVLYRDGRALCVTMDVAVVMEGATVSPEPAVTLALVSDTTSPESATLSPEPSDTLAPEGDTLSTQGDTVSPPTEPSEPSSTVKPLAGARDPRGTTAPAAFVVTDVLQAWGQSDHPRVKLEAETAKFLDYHRAKGSRFKDWTAAWRNWIRNADRFQQERQPALSGVRNAGGISRQETTGRVAL